MLLVNRLEKMPELRYGLLKYMKLKVRIIIVWEIRIIIPLTRGRQSFFQSILCVGF